VNRLVAAVVLLLRFLLAVVVSGLQTVRVILWVSGGRERRPRVVYLRMGFAPMNEAGASILGSMISLTPGTTVIDVDMERREMLLHVLDAPDTTALVAGIRRNFERYLVVVCGRPPA
jgi:multicomponent K+:H+ antiporter subunit E/multicomponent Na+:H+ antiporter subunit E